MSKPGDAGVPGRYCPPAICWCKRCIWYQPRRMSAATSTRSSLQTKRTWDERTESTWIDAL